MKKPAKPSRVNVYLVDSSHCLASQTLHDRLFCSIGYFRPRVLWTRASVHSPRKPGHLTRACSIRRKARPSSSSCFQSTPLETWPLSDVFQSFHCHFVIHSVILFLTRFESITANNVGCSGKTLSALIKARTSITISEARSLPQIAYACLPFWRNTTPHSAFHGLDAPLIQCEVPFSRALHR
jgi:hypothetical protein